jgi:hypothetical protein
VLVPLPNAGAWVQVGVKPGGGGEKVGQFVPIVPEKIAGLKKQAQLDLLTPIQLQTRNGLATEVQKQQQLDNLRAGQIVLLQNQIQTKNDDWDDTDVDLTQARQDHQQKDQEYQQEVVVRDNYDAELYQLDNDFKRRWRRDIYQAKLNRYNQLVPLWEASRDRCIVLFNERRNLNNEVIRLENVLNLLDGDLKRLNQNLVLLSAPPFAQPLAVDHLDRSELNAIDDATKP